MLMKKALFGCPDLVSLKFFFIKHDFFGFLAKNKPVQRLRKTNNIRELVNSVSV